MPELRQMGRSGLKVSPFMLGAMEWGSNTETEDYEAMFALALEHGMNVIDTANCYGSGRSEEIVGRLIAPHRDTMLLATKFTVPMDKNNPNSGGTSRYNVIASCEASLKRLNTDHIDIYYIHRPSTQIPVDETLRALEDLIRAGKIRSIGSSSFAGWQLVEGHWVADIKNLTPVSVEQTPYHLLDRRAERELIPAARTLGVGVTIWSPLAGGLLTGKYIDRPNNGVRLTSGNEWGDKHFSPAADAAIAGLAKLATEAGLPLITMSLAWTLQRPGVTSIVMGPRNADQMKQQLAAQEVELGDDLLAAIDDVVTPGRCVVPYFLDDAWADFRPHAHRW